MTINTKKYIETYLKIRDKSGNIVDLILNEPQMKLYNVIKELKQQGKLVRIVILKARQMGFSTAVEGILFKETATKFNVNTGIITHQDEATTNLFNMSKRMYDYLPDNMKPSLKASNAKELIFDNDAGTGLKSKFKCMTAGGKGVGRSDTFNNIHASEYAFWPGDKKATLIGLLQAVPSLANTIVIIESTANGYEEFKELWDKAVRGENDFYPLFVGWNELKEYSMRYTGFKLTDDEIKLKERFNLTNDQLEWRRWCIKNNCNGDLELFKQEYPITPEEAFISTGSCFFNKEIIINRINELGANKPLKQGYFTYQLVDNKIDNIKWQDDDKGYIKIFEDVKDKHPYVLGGDTAGEGSDNFTGLVIDNSNGKQVATLKRKLDEDEYSRQMYCFGMYYNTALIGIENNYSTYPTKKMQEYGYPKMFIREIEDNISEKIVDKYGFITNKATRPIILSIVKEVLRDNINWINDVDILREALVFIRNDKGRPEAQIGEHDDLIMGLAITYYIRNQQEFTVKEEIEEKKIEWPFELQSEDDIEHNEIMEW